MLRQNECRKKYIMLLYNKQKEAAFVYMWGQPL